MTVTQISVYMENKPGNLAKAIKSLSDHDVDIRAMSLADTSDFGLIRLIVSDLKKAVDALEKVSLVFTNNVLAVGMDDRSGALSEVLDLLDKEKVNIEYMYAFAGKYPINAYVVMQVDDLKRAEEVLEMGGIRMLCDENLKEYL